MAPTKLSFSDVQRAGGSIRDALRAKSVPADEAAVNAELQAEEGEADDEGFPFSRCATCEELGPVSPPPTEQLAAKLGDAPRCDDCWTVLSATTAPKKRRAKKAKPADDSPARPSLTDLQAQILALVGPLMDAEDAGDEERAAQLAAELDALGYDLDTKADGYVHVIRRFESLAAERKKAAADLAEMARADENRAKRIKARLLEALQALGQDTAGHLHRVTLVAPASTKLELVGDEADIPGRYLETVTTTRPNKAAIKAALEHGESLPFARLARVDPHLRIK